MSKKIQHYWREFNHNMIPKGVWHIVPYSGGEKENLIAKCGKRIKISFRIEGSHDPLRDLKTFIFCPKCRRKWISELRPMYKKQVKTLLDTFGLWDMLKRRPKEK